MTTTSNTASGAGTLSCPLADLDPEIATAIAAELRRQQLLVLVDLCDSELDGRQAEDRLHEMGITVNRNAVPNDPRPPMVTSGLRIGMLALTTRGFGDEDFAGVADVIARALVPELEDQTNVSLRRRVEALATRHPLSPDLDEESR